MEGFAVSGFDSVGGVRKKRRSAPSRRPRPNSQSVVDLPDFSSLPSSPPSDAVGDNNHSSSGNLSKVSSDDNGGYETGFQRRDINSKTSIALVGSVNKFEGEIGQWNSDSKSLKKIRKESGNFGEFVASHASRGNNGLRGGWSMGNEQRRNGPNFKRCSEGVLAPANWKSTSSHPGNQIRENMETQVKGGSDPRDSESYISNGRNGDSNYLGKPGTFSNGSGIRMGGVENGVADLKMPPRHKDSSSQENKLRKVKLKVGGVTRTIHAKPIEDSDATRSGAPASGSAAKPLCSSDATKQRKKLILQDNSDDEYQSPPDKSNCLQGIPWKDFPDGSFTATAKEDSRGKSLEERKSAKQTEKSHGISTCEPVRKSKRVPKKRVLDGDHAILNDDDENDELRYLERLKNSKVSAEGAADLEDVGEEGTKKRRRVPKIRMVNGGCEEDAEDYGISRPGKEGRKKSVLARGSEDTDYVEEDEPALDFGTEANRKKQKKESVETQTESKREFSLTTRQRALQSSKDVSSGNGASFIEFPNGLPPAAPRKQKEKLSDLEQQLKKAEAAQRRRMQVEKAARESEAEAIRKILGQDSNRKKKEDKLRKRLDDLAQEKAANAMTLAGNTVRWVMGPTGTVVSFPKGAELPSIFNSKPCSYPPPREKCAGPSCTNPYKYRDSKSKLPLCSLQCYRAIHEMMQPLKTC